jgi:hypothetical protein
VCRVCVRTRAMASLLRPFIVGLILFLSILTQIETRTVSIIIKKKIFLSYIFFNNEQIDKSFSFLNFYFCDVYRLKMMMVYRMLKKKDNIINILMINDSDILSLHLHRDRIHQTNLVTHMSKVLNVKAVVLDAIVNAPERVL